MNLDRLRKDSRLRRSVVLYFFGVLALLIALATGALIGIALSSSESLSDRLAEAADYLAGGTLLLAVIAGFVALLAYAVATGTPDLQVRLKLPTGRVNELAILASAREGSDKQPPDLAASEIIWLDISVRNQSGYAAKTPGVIVRLTAMACVSLGGSRGWEEIDWIADQDPIAMQWDGGATYVIHGKSSRKLPNLRLVGLFHIRSQGRPILSIELLAEGYRREISFPVDWIVAGESQYPRDGNQPPEWK